MSQISVNTGTLDAQAGQLQSIASQLGQVSSGVSGAMNSLNWKIAAAGSVRTRLQEQSNRISVLRGGADSLQSALASISASYQATENRLSGNTGGTRSSSGGNGGGSGTPGSGKQNNPNGSNKTKKEKDKKEVKYWEWKDFWSQVKNFGIIGSGIATIGGLVTGKWSTGPDIAKTLLGGVKDVAKVTENIGKAASSSSFDWKTLFGLNAAITADSPTNFWQALAKEAGKYDMGNATKVGEKIAVGAKWAGSILTVVTTAVDNFTDKENSTGRAIAETIGESAIKIGGGMLISAGVSAGLAALGFVGAPALAVGAITVGVTWGINALSKAVFGKGAAELISDAVIDGSLWVGKKIGEAGKAIGNAASAAGKVIKSKVTDVGRTVAKAAEKTGKAIGNAAKSVGNVASSAGKKIGSFFSNAGGGIRRAFSF